MNEPGLVRAPHGPIRQATHRLVRQGAQQLADQRDGSLQYPLRVLHARKRDSSLNSTIPELPGSGWLAAEPEATPQTHRLRLWGFPTVSPSHPGVFPHHGIQRITVEFSEKSPENPEFLPRNQLLSFEEIERFVRIVAPLGINKIRLTGGEPLVRRELPVLVEKLAAIPGVKDIGLTTNGILLAPLAQALWNAGLRRINVSLDTMDPDRFQQLTRRTGFEQVIEGILAAKAAGFDPVKVNAVAMKGRTEEDIVPLARFAREHGLEVRFIEYMPLDGGLWEREKVLFAAEILDRLTREIGPLVPSRDQDPRAPRPSIMTLLMAAGASA